MLVTGCAKPPKSQAILTTQSVGAGGAGVVPHQPMPAKLADAAAEPGREAATAPVSLAGRTLYVETIADLGRLRPGEIILTFDDGPHPAITPRILAILKQYDVRATFFMVGNMARNHAETALLVAEAGHTIGSHSHGHENFVTIGHAASVASVAISEDEIATALRPVGVKPAPFFRFPYLAETRALRADLTDVGFVVFDVDVDSLDYLDQSSDTVLARTLARLDEKGRGIVLFHDIHARTARLLPGFLDALAARGYTVVRAVPKRPALFDMLTVAALR
ncbi:MAG: polysaccharide deacetylase family protein [Alphaproteobacteria bacterium]|nr:polysaccharide deacetylase family protein [Alphaproteobacteria bacterium]